MNHLIAILFVALFWANAGLVQEPPAITPASVFHQEGVTVISPNQPGWTLLQSSKSETAFEKRVADELQSANVKTFKKKISGDDKELLVSLEALKKEELSKLNRDSIHFNYVRFKGSPCLQYDGIFKLDVAPPTKPEYLNLNGYLCPHPYIGDLVVQMELSNHSKLRGFQKDFTDLADEFFERIAFPK
jgi:hypothetical protein